MKELPSAESRLSPRLNTLHDRLPHSIRMVLIYYDIDLKKLILPYIEPEYNYYASLVADELAERIINHPNFKQGISDGEVYNITDTLKQELK